MQALRESAMSFTLDLESVEGVVVGIAQGPMTLDEIKKSAAQLLRMVDEGHTRLLWDLRAARFDLTVEQVRELSEYVKQIEPERPYRSAFVVARDLEFGLVRMFEVFRESAGVATSVFRERREAIDWLRIGAR